MVHSMGTFANTSSRWWTISGVELNLSPFQMAKMFNAPLFKDVSPSCGASGILKEMGDVQLKLGTVDDNYIADGLDSRASAGSGSRLEIRQARATSA